MNEISISILTLIITLMVVKIHNDYINYHYDKVQEIICDIVKSKCIKELKENNNPPLKLDDLKKDMWIWYNDKYRKVYKVDKENNIVVLVETGYLKPIEYEENKFYRYEVHGNETKI